MEEEGQQIYQIKIILYMKGQEVIWLSLIHICIHQFNYSYVRDKDDSNKNAVAGQTDKMWFDAYEVTEPVTIEFWHTLEEMYRDDFNELVDEFEKENPNITVNVSYQGRVGEILEKILAANIAGDGLPDVFPIHSSEIQVLAENGVVENLDPYIAGNGTDVSKISMSDVYARDGSQYGLTWTITGMCWFYNQTIADQEGIQLPKTWDEMDGFLRKAAIIKDVYKRQIFS